MLIVETRMRVEEGVENANAYNGLNTEVYMQWTRMRKSANAHVCGRECVCSMRTRMRILEMTRMRILEMTRMHTFRRDANA